MKTPLDDPPARTEPPTLEEALLADVLAYVSRRIASREEAEDVAAETMQAAFADWHRFRGDDRRLWILGIARRKTVDAIRRHKRRREAPLLESLPAPHQREHDAPRREAAERLRAIVLALPDDQREALLLQHLEGLTIAQIATVMRRSPAAVNGLLQRARARAHRDGRAYFLEPEDRP